MMTAEVRRAIISQSGQQSKFDSLLFECVFAGKNCEAGKLRTRFCLLCCVERIRELKSTIPAKTNNAHTILYGPESRFWQKLKSAYRECSPYGDSEFFYCRDGFAAS
jgi:hypothetical protein